MREQLTARDLKLMCFIRDRGTMPPTTREMAEHIGTRQNAAIQRLAKLRRFGLVTWDYERARTVRLTCTLEIFALDSTGTGG